MPRGAGRGSRRGARGGRAGAGAEAGARAEGGGEAHWGRGTVAGVWREECRCVWLETGRGERLLEARLSERQKKRVG